MLLTIIISDEQLSLRIEIVLRSTSRPVGTTEGLEVVPQMSAVAWPSFIALEQSWQLYTQTIFVLFPAFVDSSFRSWHFLDNDD